MMARSFQRRPWRNVPKLNQWMSTVDGKISLGAMSIPGTHQSASRFDGLSFGWVRCQTETLEWQLLNGIRYLDFRLYLRQNPLTTKPGPFEFYHGHVYQQLVFNSALTACVKFLDANPSETIIMRLSPSNPLSKEEQTSWAEGLHRLVTDVPRERIFFGTNIPSLDAARGKIITLSDPYIAVGFQYRRNDHIVIQDLWEKPSLETKFTAIKYFIDFVSEHTKRLYLNHLSASGTPWWYASRLNLRTDNFIQQLSLDDRLGVIIFDYAGASRGRWRAKETYLIKDIIDRNSYID
ncbi:phosphatidylinositol-specific phospholipase C domain-containing protein [Pseudomonas vranovensis]|uniref:phosphatidylinositol-specific phospholipase C domain-containing protein n=1 Tax=Pseudomonas vranovensis TaxID=321661 RepID=UPI003D96434D